MRGKTRNTPSQNTYFVLEEYLVTALVPSDTACLASSPGRMRRTLGVMLEDAQPPFLDKNGRHTRSGSHERRWWTSCCRQQAWKPRWQRARRYLVMSETCTGSLIWRFDLTVDKRVQDRHGTVRNTGIRVDLLED